MLVEFQQALADLVARPELCREVRSNPSQLRRHYDLSPREYARVVEMVNQDGMACNCMLYRANRLAPLALNLPEFCRAMGSRLGSLLSEYSILHPHSNVHFYLECHRFCCFILDKVRDGYYLEPHIKIIFDRELSQIETDLTASYSVL
jgi:hypothetical protein